MNPYEVIPFAVATLVVAITVARDLLRRKRRK